MILAQAGPVDGHRLLDERVDPFLDGVGQMERPEMGRRGQDDQVDLVDDVLVRVESGVLAILGDVDPRADADAPLSSDRLSSSRSAKASAMATSLTPESAVSACPAAPVPRPPQPISPTLIVLLPAAWTSGTVKPVEIAVAWPRHRHGRRALHEITSRARRRRQEVGSPGSSIEVGQSRQGLLIELSFGGGSRPVRHGLWQRSLRNSSRWTVARSDRAKPHDFVRSGGQVMLDVTKIVVGLPSFNAERSESCYMCGSRFAHVREN